MMFANGTLWAQILLDGAILLSAALAGLAWIATIGRAYRELRAAGLPRLDLLFWLALVIVLPVVGFVIYRVGRQVEVFLLPAAQPAGMDSVSVTLPAGPVEGLRWRLLVVSGPDEGRSVELGEMPALIGRGRGAHVRLDQDGGVSRRHAEVYTAGDGLRVRDLGSRHGIAVNERPVRDAPLRPGDRLQVGGTTLFLQMGRMP